MLKKMRINKRLTVAFILVTAITSVAAIAGSIAMMYISNQYTFALKNYGFTQGDIGKAMIVFADARSATRAVIGYLDEDVISGAIETHDQKKTTFEQYMSTISKTLITDEEKAFYNDAQKYLTDYWKLDAQILELGNTTDSADSIAAQEMAASELDPLYESIYTAMAGLMGLNVDTGNELDQNLGVLSTVLLIVIIGIIVFSVIISVLLGKKIANGIAKPLGSLSERLISFAQGDLSSPFPKVESHDEVADMALVADDMAKNLSLIIKDMGRLLGMMADGNYAVHSEITDKYVGDFKALSDAMIIMNSQMNDTLHQIEAASDQVSAGSSNLAQSAQSLAEGATEQAGAIEELQATIINLTEGVLKTAESVDYSYQQASKYALEASDSKKEMEVMVEAMVRISETSQKIGNIISDIEEIASQTNLLSLNASIEAARAGEAGRGFAVVADQIGKLAEQSAASAVDTRQLIESSIQEVENGNHVAEKVAVSIGEVVEGVNQIAETSRSLKEISTTQAEAMKQAEAGVGQISEVVQANSATAEETSATSEELSAQAETLNELVLRFTLTK